MRAGQSWVWRQRRVILTVLFIICAAGVMMGPTQAVSGLVAQSLDFLLTMGQPPGLKHESEPPAVGLTSSSSSSSTPGSGSQSTPVIEGAAPGADGFSLDGNSAPLASTANTESDSGAVTHGGGPQGPAGGSSPRGGHGGGGSSAGSGGGSGLGAGGGGGGGFMSPESALEELVGEDAGLLTLNDGDDFETLVEAFGVSDADEWPSPSSSDPAGPAPSNSTPSTFGSAPSSSSDNAGPGLSFPKTGFSLPDVPGLSDLPDEGGGPPTVAGDDDFPPLTVNVASTERLIAEESDSEEITAVPEPTSLALLALGLSTGLTRRYRRRDKSR